MGCRQFKIASQPSGMFWDPKEKSRQKQEEHANPHTKDPEDPGAIKQQHYQLHYQCHIIILLHYKMSKSSMQIKVMQNQFTRDRGGLEFTEFDFFLKKFKNISILSYDVFKQGK